jgi:hypothetical protein
VRLLGHDDEGIGEEARELLFETCKLAESCWQDSDPDGRRYVRGSMGDGRELLRKVVSSAAAHPAISRRLARLRAALDDLSHEGAASSSLPAARLDDDSREHRVRASSPPIHDGRHGAMANGNKHTGAGTGSAAGDSAQHVASLTLHTLDQLWMSLMCSSNCSSSTSGSGRAPGGNSSAPWLTETAAAELGGGHAVGLMERVYLKMLDEEDKEYSAMMSRWLRLTCSLLALPDLSRRCAISGALGP